MARQYLRYSPLAFPVRLFPYYRLVLSLGLSRVNLFEMGLHVLIRIGREKQSPQAEAELAAFFHLKRIDFYNSILSPAQTRRLQGRRTSSSSCLVLLEPSNVSHGNDGPCALMLPRSPDPVT